MSLSRCVVMQETQGLDNSLPTGLLGQSACALLSIVQNDLKFVLISTSNNDSTSLDTPNFVSILIFSYFVW